MALLADWLLEVGGKVFGTSWPEKGDVTRSQLDGQSDPSKLSFGVSASDLTALTWLIGKTARLLDVYGQEVARLRIEKVDPELAILVATRLTQEALPRSNASAERQVSTDGHLGPARPVHP
jgi:hypothetical protein